jgi:hypothetical protein
MKLRLIVVSLVAAVLFAACGRFFVVQDKLNSAKKVALVQYAINPHFLLGYPNDPNVKVVTAQHNMEQFQKDMGNVFEVVPAATVTGNADYTAVGKPNVDGWYSANGMRFIDDQNLNSGELLDPEVAKKLCAALGVDAVVTITDGWGQAGGGFFKGIAQNSYYINAYDKDGTKIWTDYAMGRSTETFGVPPGGVITSDDANWAKVQSEAFADALSQFKGRLGK